MACGGGSCLRGDGDRDRKVRSVIELELGWRRRLAAGRYKSKLARDDTEALRRTERLGWTSATRVGAIGRARKAAAAAADDKELVNSRRFMKADAAAVAALGFAVWALRGYVQSIKIKN